LLPGGRYRNYLSCGIGAVVYTALKLLVTRFVITQTPNYQFAAPVIGDAPYIYFVLVATSLISYVLAARHLGDTGRWENPITGPFFNFLLLDSIQYTFVFVLYAVTTILLTKI
jgi:hypothetical protein